MIPDMQDKTQAALDIAEDDLCSGRVTERAIVAIENVTLADGRDAQVQIVIETDEGEWIAE